MAFIVASRYPSAAAVTNNSGVGQTNHVPVFSDNGGFDLKNTPVTIDSSGNVGGIATLTVTTLEAVTTVSTGDTIVSLNDLVTSGSPANVSSGLEVWRGASTKASLIWKESDARWEAGLQGSESKLALFSDFGNLTDAGTDGIVVTGGTGATFGSVSLAQHVADATHNGYLSQTDWSTFNGKQNALTFGNLTDAGTDGIVVTNGTGSVIGSGTSLAQHVADASHNGYLSSTDWSTFNNKQPAGSYAVTALSNLATTSINKSLVPDTDATYDLGSGSDYIRWRTLYVAQVNDSNDGLVIDVENETLYNAGLVPGRSLSWGNRALYKSSLMGPTLDWENCYVSDTSGVAALEWSLRQLRDTTGATALSWSSATKLINLPGLTASRVVQTDSSKNLESSSVSTTTLGYLDATSSIQTQLNAKQSTSLTSAHVLVGNVSNVATDVAVSGDLTALNTGAFTVAKIQTTTVSGTTGSGNVVFSASPTVTGTLTGATATFSSDVKGATVGVNLSGSLDTNALLQIDSTTKGFLNARLTTAQRDAISSPTTGMEIFNSTTGYPEYWNGLFWQPMGEVKGQAYSQGFDDFFTQTTASLLNWFASALGTGASVSVLTAASTFYGALRAVTGSTTTGLAVVNKSSNGWEAGLGRLVFQARVRFPTLSVVGDEYASYIGYANNSLAALPTNGIYFSYDRVNDGNFWTINTSAASTRTKTVTSTAVAANTWYTLLAIVNAAGTSVTFYVNGTSIGTHSANIPTANFVYPSMTILKSAGTTSLFMDLDFWYELIEFTTQRT